MCVRLLKINIFQYIPSPELIEELDRYLQNLFHSLDSEKCQNLRVSFLNSIMTHSMLPSSSNNISKTIQKSIQFGRAQLNSPTVRNKQFILNKITLKVTISNKLRKPNLSSQFHSQSLKPPTAANPNSKEIRCNKKERSERTFRHAQTNLYK